MASADEYAAWIVKNADKKGTPEFDIVAKAYQDARAPGITYKAPSKQFGEQLNDEIANIPRQIGLTARHGIEGVGEAVDFLATPFRAAVNAVLPEKYAAKPGLGKVVADNLGLPTPKDATERIVGDASRMVAGGAVPLGLASKAAPMLKGVPQAVATTLSANPMQQLVSAGAAGGAGGYTRETGGGDGAQMLAAITAGVAAPMALNKGQQIAASASNFAKRVTNPVAPAPLAAQVDVHINRALQDSGFTLADLPANVQQGIRADVQQAINGGTAESLSPDAIRRLADYRMTGATPTAATITRDPALFSQQKNLAKLGINSKDPAAQTLGRIENTNNNKLIELLNERGAGTADNPLTAGRKIVGALELRNDAAKSAINQRYDAARASNGRSAAIDPSYFTQSANNLLDDALLGGKLPADVRNLLNKAATGDLPLTVDVAEQFKTRIGDLQRASNDMAERKALGLVRQALDDAPLLDGQGQQALDAFNKARRLNRAWMGIVEKTPALQAVRDGIEPDKFVQQFVVGGGSKANVADLEALKRSVKSNPEAMAAVKNQIAAHLKNAALNGAADEVGNFSQSGYNKALKAIGDEKLAMFFAPDEVAQLKAVGRVASYEQVQPKGSAVNNSNTAGTAMASILDRIGNSPLLRKIPFGNALADPMQNISVGIQAKQALDVPNALTRLVQPRQQSRPAGLLLSPAAFMGGDERDKNSLLPRR